MNGLATARGIVVSVLFSVPIWAVVGFCVWEIAR